jgi:hypothetical protein
MLTYSDELKDENAQRHAESFWGKSFFWDEYDLEREHMLHGDEESPSAQIIPFPVTSRRIKQVS